MSQPAAIGIDVGGTKLVAATVTADGEVLTRLRRETPADDAERLVATLEAVLAELGTGLPVGVGIAGLVTPDGIIRYGPNIGIEDLALAERLTAVVGHPVAVVNDASAATLAEQGIGAARGHRDVAMFTLGTGVGGGLVVDGALVLGATGYAGELGHVIVEEGGRRCPCGNRGCIEAYASGRSIGLLAQERLERTDDPSRLREVADLSGRDVSTAAAGGDEVAGQVLAEAGHWLGVAVASIANALDPSIVLVGGGAGPHTAPWLLPAARASTQERLVGSAWRSGPPIEPADLGDDAGMVGAALVALDRHRGGATPVGGMDRTAAGPGGGS